MAQEIERKFLVEGSLYKQMAYTHSHIAQGYICRETNRTVRVRIRGEKGFLTIKGPSLNGGVSRYEWEHQISLEEARELMKLCQPGVIEKVRYLVKSGRHTFEVDEFLGENVGLVLAEVELSDPNEQFLPPPFLGKEVTGDRRYYNSYLTEHPYAAAIGHN